MKNYRAFITDGSIIECDNFKVLYKAVRRHLYSFDEKAAILMNINTNEKVCYMAQLLYKVKPYRVNPITSTYIKNVFSHSDGAYFMDMTGLND